MSNHRRWLVSGRGPRRSGAPRRALALALPLGLLLAFAAPLRADEVADRVARLHERLSAWDLDSVAGIPEAMLAGDPERVDVRLLYARLKLMQREFDAAAAALEGLCGTDVQRPVDAHLCDVVEGSLRVTRDFKSTPTDGGHFVLHYLPGPDEVLVPYASETLEAAYEALGARFGYRPPAPVHIDFLPTVEALADMTPLTRDEIQASGTIAMCKYDRMMVVSPRDLIYGYGWRDTLAHEYIHFVLTRRSGNRVPLWLHEGLAKYFESTWRAGAAPALAPPTEHLLAEAIKAKRLIELARLHPSIGKLPSQEDAALAFAQVYTIIDWLHRKRGMDGINELLERLTAGDELDAALETVYGLTFRRLETTWRKWLDRRTFKRIPDGYKPKLLFRGKDRTEDEIAEIEEERGRDHAYLGDLLRARGRIEAALVEYDKAVQVVGSGSPVIQSKLAATQITLGRYGDVLRTVERVLHSFPQHVLLHLYQGEALLRLGRARDAIPWLVEAIGLNPFDEKVHLLLAEAYEAVGERERAAFERRQHALVETDGAETP